MVKVISPLMSESAHGSIAKIITYSKKRTGQQVRDFHYPKKSISQKQWTQRHIIGLLTAQWQTMTSAQKLVYTNLAKSKNLSMTGFNYFVKVALADLYTHTHLVAYWSFNELTGNTVYDYSGNGHHALLKPTYPSNCPTRANSINEKYGKALYFNGTSYVQTPSFTIPNTGILTVEVWMKSKLNADGQGIVCTGAQSFTVGFILMLRFFNNYDLSYGYASGTNWPNAYFTNFFQNLDSQWIHVVIVSDYNNKTIKAYRNGVQFGNTQNLSGTPVFPLINATKYIGAYNSAANRLIDGSLDEVRIYNRGLGADEIWKHSQMLRFDKNRQPGWHPLKK